MSEVLKALFDRRDKVYIKLTNEILDALTPNVISAVVEVLDLSSQELSHLSWQKVDTVDGHIVLLGSISYKAGDVVEENGDKVTLTQAAAMMLGKFVRLALPFEVTTMTKEDIIKHLRDVEAKMKSDYEDTYGKPPHDDVVEIEGDSIQEALANMTQQMESSNLLQDNALAGFDYSKLTPEQRQQLQMTQMLQPDKKKMN